MKKFDIPFKVLYATGRYSPLRPDDGSGTDFRLNHAIQNQGIDLQFIGPFGDKTNFLERLYRKLHQLFTKKRPAKYSMAL